MKNRSNTMKFILFFLSIWFLDNLVWLQGKYWRNLESIKKVSLPNFISWKTNQQVLFLFFCRFFHRTDWWKKSGEYFCCVWLMQMKIIGRIDFRFISTSFSFILIEVIINCPGFTTDATADFVIKQILIQWRIRATMFFIIKAFLVRFYIQVQVILQQRSSPIFNIVV